MIFSKSRIAVLAEADQDEVANFRGVVDTFEPGHVTVGGTLPGTASGRVHLDIGKPEKLLQGTCGKADFLYVGEGGGDLMHV